jgi:hypothetical protein
MLVLPVNTVKSGPEEEENPTTDDAEEDPHISEGTGLTAWDV